MELDKAIKERRSVRSFNSRTPDWRTIIECIDSMRYAPMAGNAFSLKFILVDDPEKIVKLAQAAQQDYVAQSQYVLVVCSDKKITVNEYGKRGEIYLHQQAGAAIQNLLLRIVEEGLATCWVGHFVENQVKKTLSIPPEINIECILPIGYEEGKIHRKRKPELDNFLFFNKYKNKKLWKPHRVD